MAKSERRTVDGIHFLRLQGSAQERVRGHARLLRDEIRGGALPALAKKNEWLIRRGPGLVQNAAVQDTIVWLYKNVLVPFLDRNSDEETREVVRVMAAESGLPESMIRESHFQADGLMLLSRTSVMKYLLKELPTGGLPGCTSGVAMKEWTRAGRMLVCRNQDYPMVGPWEANTAVLFMEPEESGQIPHVAVTTAGVHTAGLTTMNREGLTLATHAHFGRSISFRGKTVVSLGNEVIRRARTIGEAVDIARKNRRHANWAYVVSSAKENDAVVIEMTPDRTCVRHAEDGLLTHSNFFHSPELRGYEALLSGGCCEDLVARVCRLRQIFEPDKGRLEPSHLAAALGDHIDPQTGEERIFGNTVSVVTTIKSVVFEPESQKMWVASRQESPVGLNGDYVEVDVENFWKSEMEAAPLERLRGYQPRKRELIEGVRHYRDAYRAWHMNPHEKDHCEKTMIALRKALAAYPDDGNVWLQAGIIAFRQHEFEEARSCFESAMARVLATHVGHVCHLYVARCMDLMGEREKALEIYRRLATEVQEPKLRKAFRKGVRRAYRARETGMMMIDLQFPDTFQY